MASASSFSTSRIGTVIHVGFKLDANNEKLKALFPDVKFIEDPIVAVIYRGDQNEMRLWYNKMKSKKMKAYVRGYYYVPNRAIVLHMTIENSFYWVTVMNYANFKPINVKLKVGSGELGKKVEVERFEMDATAYYFID